MNRALWKDTVDPDALPAWPCPNCGSGTLELVRSSLKSHESLESRLAHDHDAWDPDWITERFVGVLKCTRSACGDIVAFCGDSSYREAEFDRERGDHDWDQVLSPRYFSPALPLIAVPEQAPDEIKQLLMAVFALFWASPPAAGNRLRATVEELLTFLKVKQFVRPKGPRRRVPLHQRIVFLRKRKPTVAERLMALKWLGNDASHSGDLKAGDIMDGLEIIDDVLDDLFAGRKRRLEHTTKAINRRRGALSRRK